MSPDTIINNLMTAEIRGPVSGYLAQFTPGFRVSLTPFSGNRMSLHLDPTSPMTSEKAVEYVYIHDAMGMTFGEILENIVPRAAAVVQVCADFPAVVRETW